MQPSRPVDLGATIAGVHLPFCAMNASGAWSASAAELRDLARSHTGAIVLKTATVHPFVHPAYRSLHNPGYAKLAGLVRELAAVSERPVIASVAGASIDEYVTLARAFADAGAALVEANVAEPYVAATLGPLEEPGTLRELATRLVAACAVPVAVKLPDAAQLPYRRLVDDLGAARVPVVVAKNDFTGFEKLMLEAQGAFQVIAYGGIRSGYDVSRALSKGAVAVQVRSALVDEGPGIFARLEREMRIARAARPA
jgi:dihydroorotate dehydrogenase (fumarate)